jgi:hypothetical protein
LCITFNEVNSSTLCSRISAFLGARDSAILLLF